MKLSEFDYSLPKALIAQYPLKERDASRLLVLDRKSGKMEHRHFKELPEYLKAGDALVLNDTKVKRTRLFGRKETGGKVEALFLRKLSSLNYDVLLNSSARILPGRRLFFGNREAKVVGGNGIVKRIRFRQDSVDRWLDRKGTVPLPPYIVRPPEKEDVFRYQTVYAEREGAVAAPTAGLHFTKRLLQEIGEKGVRISPVTLHVGYGTFEPVRSEIVSEHKMHEEYFELPSKTALSLNETRKKGGKIIAVGTTSCRVLETTAHPFRPTRGWTALFIYPPYSFQGTDILLTNFHLPKTTLFMLVSAFAGKTLLRKAYGEAIREKYRFYSYGDAMLIL